MGRIVAQVVIENAIDRTKRIECSALVDTGASQFTLPLAWKDQLGEFADEAEEEILLADQSTLKGVICGPARIQIEGFRPVSSEVLFIEMDEANGHYEPLLGYVPLEQSLAAVDMLGHRLVPVKYLDLK